MPKRDSGHTIGPNQPATHAYLENVRREVRARRPKLHTTVSMIVRRYLDPDDAWRVQRCQQNALRLRHPAERADRLVMARCGNMFCGACARMDHWRRTRYQGAKIASVIPGGELRLGHSVWTLPPALRPLLAADARALNRFRAAVFETIRKAYGKPKRKNDPGIPSARAAQRELGLVANLHPFGDEATPFPVWAPHLDVLVPGVRHAPDGIRKLPARWPQRFDDTCEQYRLELRRFLAPLARGRLEATFLETEFDLDVYFNEPQKSHMLRGGRAWRAIAYSCRPHFEMTRAHLEDPEGPAPVLVYEPHSGTKHRRDPRDFFRDVYRIYRKQLDGRLMWGYMGNLSRRAYARTVQAAGNEPVEWRPKSGWALECRYRRGADGRFDEER